MTALSDEHMEVTVTDPNSSGCKKLSSRASTATTKGTITKGRRTKKHGPSSPSSSAKQGTKSPTPARESQQRNSRHGKSVKSTSEATTSSCKVNHTEHAKQPELDRVANIVAQDKEDESMSIGEQTTELVENGHGDFHEGGASNKKGSAAASPSRLVEEEDSSVVVKVDKNDTKLRPLGRVTQKQESKGNKFQFSNQLAFSLDVD